MPRREPRRVGFESAGGRGPRSRTASIDWELADRIIDVYEILEVDHMDAALGTLAFIAQSSVDKRKSKDRAGLLNTQPYLGLGAILLLQPNLISERRR